MNTEETAGSAEASKENGSANMKAQQQQQQPMKRPSLASSRRPSLLSTKSMYFGIPTAADAQDHAEEEHGTHSWRYRVVAFLHKSAVQKFVMGLLLTDVILLFAELFLLATFPHCAIIERDGLSCVPSNSTEAFANTTDHGSDGEHRWLHVARFLAGDSGHHGDDDVHHGAPICEEGYEWNGLEAGCDEHKWSSVHKLETFIFSLTVIILSLFFIELTVEMLALTPQIFFRQFWFLLDYVIISISLALEIAFRIKREDVYQSFAGLLVVVRIWRFVRIGHGIVEVTHENEGHAMRELLGYAQELEDLLQSNGVALPGSAQHIHEVHHDHAKHLLEVIQESSSKKTASRVRFAEQQSDIDEGKGEDPGDDEEQVKDDPEKLYDSVSI